MVDENEQQKYLEEFNGYFPESDRESGVIKEIKEDLERIKKIDDLEEKVRDSSSILEKHMSNRSRAEKCYHKLQDSNISEFDTIDKYKKHVDELSSYRHGLLLENIKRWGKKRREENNKNCPNCQDTQNQLDQAKQEIQNLQEKLAKFQNQENNVNVKADTNQIKSNQIKSNQIKSNQIKSNQIKWMVGF